MRPLHTYHFYLDIPDNLIRGLSLVVASNALNNVDLNHGPFAILQALHAVDYTKTVEFFTSALARQMRSTSLRYVLNSLTVKPSLVFLMTNAWNIFENGCCYRCLSTRKGCRRRQLQIR